MLFYRSWFGVGVFATGVCVCVFERSNIFWEETEPNKQQNKKKLKKSSIAYKHSQNIGRLNEFDACL